MTSVKDLTIQQEDGSLVSWEEFAGEWDELGLDDLQPSFPFIKVVSNVSKMEGARKHGGDFHHSDRDGDDAFDSELMVVPLVRSNNRAFFEAAGDQPLCRSIDGKVPQPDQELWHLSEVDVMRGGGTEALPIPHAQPRGCDTCVFSQFGPNNEAPYCKESDVYLVDRGQGDLAQLRVSGMNLGPLRHWIRTRCLPKKIPPFNFRLRLTTVEKSKGQKTWSEIVVVPELLKPAEARVYAELLKAERERFQATLKNSKGSEWQDDHAPAADWEEA